MEEALFIENSRRNRGSLDPGSFCPFRWMSFTVWALETSAFEDFVDGANDDLLPLLVDSRR
jgi:hypothetical protein